MKATDIDPKREIVCAVLGLTPGECSHGDAEYIARFESEFGELTRNNFIENFDSAEFTEWAVDLGY